MISIKNEVIDTEYEINENVNKTQKDNHEIQINKQNDEDSLVVNTRKTIITRSFDNNLWTNK